MYSPKRDRIRGRRGFNHPWQESRREGLAESHERESMTEGGGVFINREIADRGKRGFIHGKKAKGRECMNLMREKARQKEGVCSTKER